MARVKLLAPRRQAAAVSAVVAVLLATPASAQTGTFQASAFRSAPDRVWIGPDYWANPLQDWRVAGVVLRCVKAGPNRNVHLLTRDLDDGDGDASVSVGLAAFEPAAGKRQDAWVGVRLAARGRFGDYRDNAVYGKGIDAGLRGDGRLFAGEATSETTVSLSAVETLAAALRRSGAAYVLQLAAFDAEGREIGRVSSGPVAPSDSGGNVALVCHEATCGFEEWRLAGTKVRAHRERAFGPILFAQYTLSRRVLTLTAQLAPVSNRPARPARLEARPRRGEVSAGSWKEVSTAPVDPLARTATFRVTNWDDTRDHDYRVLFEEADRAGREAVSTFEGIVRRDPRDKARVVVAAFTGNNDLGFPHADVVRHVSAFQPDLLIFTGDQIYEPVGGFGIQREPLEAAVLDYLRKWYIFGWEYRDLLRQIPSVALPDDHDVYHGNLWGAGGLDANGPRTPLADNGGYIMPVEWVNMVQRTQTGHLPAPVDPAPTARGIGVYFTQLVWGGISFAVIEDRKWKSAPAVLLPEAQIVNGWAQNPAFDSARSGDAAGAELLGERQMRFLERWAEDWPADVWMKAVVSQTLFADVATLPRGERADAITTKLEIQPPGGYAAGEWPVQDHDSNGWPQSPRNAALRLMRKAKAVHIAGDQHLGSTIQYGIDEFRDGPFAICVPSVANYWPRRWYPPEPGGNRAPGAPRYTGDYLDGFGNRMTVLAVSNPHKLGVEPADVNDRAPGYGIVTFERATRRITFANWPRWVDPSKPGAAPYPGWPITVHQEDNAGRR